MQNGQENIQSKVRVPTVKELFLFSRTGKCQRKYFFKVREKSRNFVIGLTVKFENGAKFREFCI